MRNKMNDMSIKQLLKFFAVITLIVALFIAGAYLFLRWAVNVEVPEAKPSEALPQIRKPNESELTPQVIYDGQAFRPARVLRDGSGSIGCIVVLVNRSIIPLRIGLNPHNPAGDPGPNYGTIAPGDKLIFDPRFVGITGLRFHNHASPEQEFFIELGPKCQI
ncbi:MAG: hypothetical protein WAP51_04340 [Candidatus Sungiibacteriota bacterium]